MSTRFSMEQYRLHNISERDVDTTIRVTFPASSPPSTGGGTRKSSARRHPNPGGQRCSGTQPDEDVPDEDTPAEPSPGEPPEEKEPRNGSFK
jgi:hypothetical protein